MSIFLLITMAIALFGAVCAMSLRNLVHCALTLAVSFSAVAAIYLQLNAEFAGFTEILVYVGAIAILIVMAILLTRSGEAPEHSVLTAGWLAGVAVTVMVFVILGWAVLSSHALPAPPVAAPQTTVKDIGDMLMTKYVIPLEVIALMLTVAMIGAVVIAFKEEPGQRPQKHAPAADVNHPAPPANPQSSILNPQSPKGGAA
jgi:NADH-quinone oxidoreductase subunit J